MAWKTWAIVLACGLGAAAGVALVRWRARPARNAILVSIDTLRADHLGCYGHEAETSPAIDAFRRDAILYAAAYSHAPSTLVSHASMLTSTLPQRHGALFSQSSAVSEAVPTLAEVLSQAGLETVSWNGGGQLHTRFGLGRGFEAYHELPDEEDSLEDGVDRAIAWLGARTEGSRPFFLFLHTYEVHHPYEPEAARLAALETRYEGPLPDAIPVEMLERINAGELSIDAADLAHIRNAYDAEIRSMDEAFGRLVAHLKESGLYDETAIVFTSDHGEEFDEHGKVGWHSHTLFDELLHVPLIVKLARSRAGNATVARQVRLIDLAPTVLAALGLEPAPSFEGVSLADPGALDEAPELAAVARMDRKPGSRDAASIRLGSWKLWGAKLFDLNADPRELTDVAASHPRVAEELAQVLARLAGEDVASASQPVTPSDEALERLRSLGYLH